MLTRITTLLFVLAGVFTFAPPLAFANTPTPSPTSAYCFTYENAGPPITWVNQCEPSMAACVPASAGKTVLHACSRVGNPDPSTIAAGQQNAFDAQAILTKGKDTSIGGSGLAYKALAYTVGYVLEGISWLFFAIAATILRCMGTILDFAISITLNSDLLGNLAFVNVGWTAVRDLSNMFFIFALLYIAIQTILGLAGGSAKRWVAHIIIAAILINFSLFFTKVVIDAGNVLAFSFWDKLQVKQGTLTVHSAAAKSLGALDLQTAWSDKADSNVGKQIKSLDPIQRSALYAGGSVFMFIAAFIFLAIIIMMVTRTIALILLMVFSPFAFMALGLPKMEKYGHEWWGKLVEYTFAAPVFLFMMYLNSVLSDSMDLLSLSGSSGTNFSGAITGTGSFAIIFNFILLIGFLLASLHIAQRFGGQASSGAVSFANRMRGAAAGAAVGGTFFAAGAAGRQTLGRLGGMTAENKKLNELAKSENFIARRIGNLGIATGSAMKKSTYDIRNAPMGGLGTKSALAMAGVNAGTGTKRSYATTGAQAGTRWIAPAGQRDYRGTEKEAEYIKIANERFKNDPVGRQKFLEDKLGSQYNSDGRLKDTYSQVQRDVTKQKSKDTIDAQTKQQEELEKKKSTMSAEEYQSEGKKIGDEIAKAMYNLNSREVADLLPKYVNNSAFLGNLRTQDLHVIQQLDTVEGKYSTLTVKDPADDTKTVRLSDRVAQGVMEGNNEQAKKYLMSTEGQQKLFNFDAEKYREDYAVAQKNQGRIADANQARDAAYVEKAERDAKDAQDAAKASERQSQDFRDKMKDIRQQNKR